jgi:hypothetical protein
MYGRYVKSSKKLGKNYSLLLRNGFFVANFLIGILHVFFVYPTTPFGFCLLHICLINKKKAASCPVG